MKSKFLKQSPEMLYYRNYKYFDNDLFRNDLFNEQSKQGFRNIECKKFQENFLLILNKYAPMKNRYLRANNAPFMTNTLCKAIMVRSTLRNKYLKLKTKESQEAYKKQRNLRVSILRESKKSFYENLDVKFIKDNKTFWKHVKPFFLDKSSNNSNIILVESNKIISDCSKCAEIMNNHFSGVVNKLDIDRELHTEISNSLDPATRAIEKYKTIVFSN